MFRTALHLMDTCSFCSASISKSRDLSRFLQSSVGLSRKDFIHGYLAMRRMPWRSLPVAQDVGEHRTWKPDHQAKTDRTISYGSHQQ